MTFGLLTCIASVVEETSKSSNLDAPKNLESKIRLIQSAFKGSFTTTCSIVSVILAKALADID